MSDFSIKGGFSVRKMILVFLLMLCVATTASAANFVEIIRDDSFLVYLDLDSLQDKGDYLTCWTKWIPRGKEAQQYKNYYKKTVVHQMIISAYKKNTCQKQDIAIYTYFKEGNYSEDLVRNLTSEGWQDIIPQSYGESVWKVSNSLIKQ